MHGDEAKYMMEAYDTNWMSTVGKNIDETEKRIAEYVGVKHAVALSAGTAALHLATKLAGEKVYGQARPYEGTLKGRRGRFMRDIKLNKELKIYGADMAGTAPALAYCDYSRCVVGMRDPAYIDNLISICKEDKIDLVIPTIDTDLLVLSENKEKFLEVGTKVMISNPDMIRICRDKNNTSQFFVDCGLHAPMPVNDWTKYQSGYPAFIKPKNGSSSINAFKVENAEEMEVYAGQVEDYIVQPFVSGHEYTIDIFCDWEGKPISIVPRERIQVRAGEVLKTRIELDQTMIDEGKTLCSGFKPCGPMTVQLIRDDQGVDWFIEINPRFGGGAPLSMKAGARSAEAILKLLEGESIEYITSKGRL